MKQCTLYVYINGFNDVLASSGIALRSYIVWYIFVIILFPSKEAELDLSYYLIELFLRRLPLTYRTKAHAVRLESPSALIKRQIRAPLTISYSTNEKVWYKKNLESNLEKAEFIIQKGHNTATINREKRNSIFAHADQIRPQGEYEEQNEEEISTIPSVNDLLEHQSLL